MRSLAVLAPLLIGAACTSILGDDFEIVAEGGAAGSPTTTTGGSGGGPGGGGSGGGECPSGFADCNGTDDGCETNLADDSAHCGACDRPCDLANARGSACVDGACAPSCEPTFADCTTPAAPEVDDGCETSLGTSSDCSACGHDCGGAACSALHCDPSVVFATASTGSVRSIAIDQTNVYWADRTLGQIMQSALDGSTFATLATGVLQPVNVAVDDTHVYFNEEAGLVARVPIGGGTRQNIASSCDAVGVSATHVYYDGSSAVLRKDKSDIAAAGQSIIGLATTEIIVDGTDVYFTTGASIRHYNEATLSVNQLHLAMSGTFNRMALDADNLYSISGDTGTLYRAARNGSSLTTLVGEPDMGDVAVAGPWVYYTRRGAGEVRRVPVAGGDSELVTTLPQAYSIAANADAVFISTFDTGNVYRVPLPP
jgi:hypothetical protein